MRESTVKIPSLGRVPALDGDLRLPDAPTGLVIFAHGSGSSRQSPRNRQVAAVLSESGLATLLLDLLSPEEEPEATGDRRKVFDIPLLADRLEWAVRWARTQPRLRDLPIGLFGASTGAAAALWAISRGFNTGEIAAIVSRGGRPDLAMPLLGRVRAPVLLIVGGDDVEVLELNRLALARLPEGRLEIVPGATHLFEEPGALDRVTELARNWFGLHLGTKANVA